MLIYWVSFIVGMTFLLILDLFVFNKKDHVIPIKEALWASLAWVTLALLFGGFIFWEFGKQAGLEFLTGYVVEKSLSVDNLFVMILVFESFKVPAKYQHRVLAWGIMGAVLMRGVLIVMGAALVHRFEWILYIFGAILFYSGLKFLKDSDEAKDVTQHPVTTLARKFFPVTADYHGNHFFIREHKKLFMTPLFLVVLVIEATDLVFAVDSIPAVFSVTRDPYLAFTSNILAIFGLRALYFVLADGLSKFRYLKPGLSVILMYIGLKMLLMHFFHIPTWVSLLVIMGVLSTAALSSWYVNRLQRRKKS